MEGIKGKKAEFLSTGKRQKAYQVRWNWAVPWLRRRETSLATLGFSATFSTRRGMGWTLGQKPPPQASVLLIWSRPCYLITASASTSLISRPATYIS